MYVKIQYAGKFMEEKIIETREMHVGYRSGKAVDDPAVPWLMLDDGECIDLYGTRVFVMGADGHTIDRYEFPRYEDDKAAMQMTEIAKNQ